MDIYDIRHQNLLRLIDSEYMGSQTKLARRAGLLPSQVSRWARGKAAKKGNLGERCARKLEEKCGKHSGWLDVPHLVASNQTASKSSHQLLQYDPRAGGIETIVNAWVVADENQRDIARAWASSVIRAQQIAPEGGYAK